MKDRYPYSVYWKEQEFKKCPSMPPEEVIRFKKASIIEGIIRGLKKYQKTSPYLTILSEDDIRAEAENFYLLYKVKFEEIISNRCKEEILSFRNHLGNICIEANQEFIEGKLTRDQTAKKITDKALPNFRGGKNLPSDNAAIILKKIYKELIDCIQCIWCINGIALRKRKDDRWFPSFRKPCVTSTKSELPGIDTVFTDKELLNILKQSFPNDHESRITPSEIALRIIAKRVNSAPRTLKNIFSKIPD